MERTQEEIQALNLAAQEFITTVTSMAASLRENARNIANQTGETQQKSIINTSKAVQLAEELKTFTVEQLKDKATLKKFEAKINSTKGIQAGIEAEIQELVTKQVSGAEDLTQEEKQRLEILYESKEKFEEIVGESEKLREELKRIDNEVSFFDDLNEFGKQIPGLSVLFGEFEKASKAARTAAAEGKDALSAGAAQLSSAGGKLVLSFGIKKVTEGIKVGQERITQFARQLNITRDAANELNSRLIQVAGNTTGLTVKDLESNLLAVSNYLGISADLSDETLSNIGTLTKYLGVSGEEAAKLVTYTQSLGKDTADFNKELIGSVIAQNAATDSAVRYQDVLKDVANASAATQLTTSRFPGGLAKAAFEARKLGLNLMSLEKSGQALLNFESSIESELEAELLTGKELNLERARAAALTGDQSTLAAELAKNFGTAEDFLNQNVLAQQAQAEAMGMTRDELAQTLMRQEAMQKLGVSTEKQLKETIKKEEDRIALMEQEGKYEEAKIARRKLYNTLGDEELLRQEENRSLQERMAQSMERLADAASKLAKPFDFIGTIFDTIGDTATEFLSFTTKIGSKLLALGNIFSNAVGKNLDGIINAIKNSLPKMIMSIGKSLDNILNSVKNFLPKMITSIFKSGAKIGTTTLLKKIPVLGALIGFGMAFKRMSEGDVLGGLLEIGSGVASLFPGIGTGVSIGIDAGLMGLDAAGITGEKPTVSGANIAAAATMSLPGLSATPSPIAAAVMVRLAEATERSAQAAQTTNEKLEALSKKESGVYIDSMRAGHSTALNTSRLN